MIDFSLFLELFASLSGVVQLVLGIFLIIVLIPLVRLISTFNWVFFRILQPLTAMKNMFLLKIRKSIGTVVSFCHRSISFYGSAEKVKTEALIEESDKISFLHNEAVSTKMDSEEITSYSNILEKRKMLETLVDAEAQRIDAILEQHALRHKKIYLVQ